MMLTPRTELLFHLSCSQVVGDRKSLCKLLTNERWAPYITFKWTSLKGKSLEEKGGKLVHVYCWTGMLQHCLLGRCQVWMGGSAVALPCPSGCDAWCWCCRGQTRSSAVGVTRTWMWEPLIDKQTWQMEVLFIQQDPHCGIGSPWASYI